MNVATPEAVVTSDPALADAIVDEPLPAVSVTVFPLTGLLLISFKVTVTTDACVPSATTLKGLAITEDDPASTAPAT